ncbi:MAG: hypothetical protein IJ498_08625 [Akkermansia sp.]|nr:hypothetical protein [Akkermansia sp.]
MTKKNDNTAAARHAALDDLRELAADNAAAAREEAEKTRPPVESLGKEGKENVYWARPDGSIHRLKANEHRGDFFLRMATLEDWARWVEPGLSPDEMKSAEKRIWYKVKTRLFADTLGKHFLPDRERHAGFWAVADGWLYCAGRECYFRSADDADAAAVRVDNVRGGYVYHDKQDYPAPAADALTDAEGQKLLDLILSRTWADKGSGELFAGWQVAAFYAGAMPIRPHVWINAPAGSGKSTLFADMKAIAGDFCLSVAGGASTSAGIRQSVANTALPVILDEAEAGNNEKAKKNIGEWLELMRLASYGQKMVMGGKDGHTAKYYTISNCFALASVGNTLERDADTSRCLSLELRPYSNDEEKRLLWAGQDAGRELVQTLGFHARLFARLLRGLPVLRENIRALTRHLRTLEGVDPRRGELFAVLMACRYSLTSSAPLTPEQMEHAAEVLRGHADDREKASDSERCLDEILAYKIHVNQFGVMTVREACHKIGVSINEKAKETQDNYARALETIGLRWQDDKLEADPAHPGLRRVYKETMWSGAGNLDSVLAEGATKRKGIDGANARGIWWGNVKRGGKQKRVIFIPARLIL